MSYSSVYFQHRTNRIHWWEYDENGVKQHYHEKAPMYFYMPSKEGTYTSIYGDKLKKVSFDSIKKMNDTKKMYKEAGRRLFESDINVVNRFILDNWAGVDIEKPELDIQFLDIEVHSEKGFPNPESADHPITVITVWSTKSNRFYIFAEKEFDTKFLDDNNISYWKGVFETEEDLLLKFITFIRKKHPDIISGFNSNFFDIPYIINRSIKLLGERKTFNMSPMKMIKRKKRKQRFGKEVETYEIAGINCIDYLDLYKKYSPGERESYKLDYIAKYEIGEQKIEYEGSLKDLYHKDWQKYIEYNVQDVNLLIELDNKLQFMDMMIGICYNCRIPFDQFHVTTKVLDGAFISRLMEDNVVLPDVTGSDKDTPYAGAFVMDPVVGVHDWEVSFDATSLYPSIMMEHNISPETKIGKVEHYEAKIIMDILEDKDVSLSDRNYDTFNGETCEEIAKNIKENKWSIASNGTIYRHDFKGVIPRFVEEWFSKRQKHKKLKSEAEKKEDEIQIKIQDALQLNYKILINSVYGYLGTEWSRLYDPDNALAVTATGQEIIKKCKDSIDYYFSEKWENSKIGKKLKATNCNDVVCYLDTDSNYVSVGKILNSFNYNYNDKDTKTVENFIEKNIIPLINKIIEKSMEQLACKRMNCPENKIFFKREMIARRGIHLAKKRYVAWVLNMEGTPVKEGSEHELEVKGIEIVRSSTPEIVRKYLKSVVLKIIKTLDRDKVYKEIKDIYEEFMDSKPEFISKNSTANNIEKYTGRDKMPIKGCPQHVKGAILYNKMIDDLKLNDSYEKIHEGEKVKVAYVIPQDHFRSNCISFKDKIPTEIKLTEFIDYDTMWEKVFMKPLDQFYKLLNWSIPDCSTEDIEDFFE